MKETIAKINKTKSWFLEKINKIDKPLARLKNKQTNKNQREKTLINKIKNEKEITKDNAETHRIIRGVGWNGRWEGGSAERETCIPTADAC